MQRKNLTLIPWLACMAMAVTAIPTAQAKTTPQGGALNGVGKLVMFSASRSVSKSTYNASASMAANVETPVVAWAIANLDTCALVNDGSFTPLKKNPDANGTWTLGTYTGANSCGTTTTYAAVYYTWTNTKAKKGHTDKGISTWIATCPKGVCEGGVTKYIIKNKITITYAP